MSVQALKQYTLRAKYARYNKDAKRRETYKEANDRVRNMMHILFPQVEKEIDWAYDLVDRERILGSQRALQFGGIPALRHNARVYNCTSSYCDRLRFFQEAFYLLLCGCGTGFSVQKHHIAKLPKFAHWRTHEETYDKGNPYKKYKYEKKTFVISDTIEGWADAAGVLMSSYCEDGPFPEYYGFNIEFDYHLIREEGSYLSSGAGKAPGPEPLKKALDKVRQLLEWCIKAGRDRLRPIDAYDIVMHLSDAVLAGGVRRSATICIFSLDDMEMMTAKTGNWYIENPQRGRSNNSVLLIRNQTTKEQFEDIMKHVREWGEPGFYWSDSTEQLPNPCVEIGFCPSLKVKADYASTYDLLKDYKGPIGFDGGDEQGKPENLIFSGWQFCNLTTINGQLCRNEFDFYESCRGAATIGTLQAAMTSFPYLGRITEMIVRREALLGVSITGVMDSPTILLDPRVLRNGAKFVLDTNATLAPLVGIEPCARGTCLKPEGTTSCLLGTASGAGPWKFKRGFRRVQANRNEPVANFFAKKNPWAVEKSKWCANGTTNVITFCLEAPEGAIIEGDMTAIEYLNVIKLLQENWVRPGKREERCTQPWLTNNVSNTVVVKAGEWDDVIQHIYNHRDSYAGISLLAATGDKDYIQAPFTAVYDPVEMSTEYGKAYTWGLSLHASMFAAGDDVWDACNDIMVGKGTYALMAKDIADQWFGGDVKRVTYLIKDIYNYFSWVELNQKYIEVNYDELIEEDDTTKPSEEGACVGGACELIRV